MTSDPSQTSPVLPTTRSLVHLYLNVGAWYLVLVIVLWYVGLESIYAHPTPFYGLPFPSFSFWAVPAVSGIVWLGAIYGWAARGGIRTDTRLWLSLSAGLLAGLAGFSLLQNAASGSPAEIASIFWREWRWHLVAGGVFATGIAALTKAWPHVGGTPDRRETVETILVFIAFAALFALSIAMIRDGWGGVSQAYERYTYEYNGDIGKTRTIQDFFGRYNELQPHLTMHAKVHPPGPVVVLWVFSLFIGQDPLALSIATVLFGSLAVAPFYLLAREIAGARAAVVAASLYCVMPGVALFTAVSGDVLFMPFTLTTLLCFWRAIDRGSIRYALAAGIGYAAMSLLSFSLLGIGIFFAFVGLWKLRAPGGFGTVAKTAIVMLVALLAVHAAVRGWSGYDVVENFQLAKAQFDEDQRQLDEITPRHPGWSFRLWNPLCWFFFAGIPVSLLFIKGFIARRAFGANAVYWIFALTLLVLNLLYLGRGEGERSAMYLYPFLALPAGMYLAHVCVERRSYGPFLATLMVIALQTWAIETFLYTYW